jgi:hypothetical protein
MAAELCQFGQWRAASCLAVGHQGLIVTWKRDWCVRFIPCHIEKIMFFSSQQQSHSCLWQNLNFPGIWIRRDGPTACPSHCSNPTALCTGIDWICLMNSKHISLQQLQMLQRPYYSASGERWDVCRATDGAYC